MSRRSKPSWEIAGLPITVYAPTEANPYFQIAYIKDGKRRTTTGGRTYESAQRKASEIAESFVLGPDQSQATVADLIAAYLRPDRPKARNWAPRTEAGYDYVLNRHVRATIGHVKCAELDRGAVTRAVNNPSSRGEQERVKRYLKTLLKWGWQERYIQQQPDLLIGNVHPSIGEVPKTSVQGADSLYVAAEQIPTAKAVSDLAEASSDPLMVMVAGYSGVRLGELLALTAGDVDTELLQIRVQRQVQEVRAGRVVTAPKRGKIRTTVFPDSSPVGYPIADEFRRRLHGMAPGEILFPGPRGGMQWRGRFYRSFFGPAASAAGWPATINGKRLWTWHDLRHVFCTYYLWDLGALPVDVSLAAGHASVDITLRIYGSKAPDALRRLGALGARREES